MLVFLVYAPGVNINNPDALLAHQSLCTIVLVAGLAPAAALSYFASLWRMSHFDKIVAKFK